MKLLKLSTKKVNSREERQSKTDELTGLPNRLYFKETYGKDGLFQTMRYQSVAVFDVDDFTENCQREEKDAVIKWLADLFRQSLGEKCELFRWGDDCFVALMEWSMEFAGEICKELCEKVEKDGRVTISVGITEVRLTDTIKRHYYRAMQGCYLVKEMGGNGVKRV